jgi:NCS1 nucleoside transporter family
MDCLVVAPGQSHDAGMATTAPEVTDRHYGAKVTAVEPGGAEAIPLAERHGKPIQLLWTWTSPNMEFATVFVGIICVLFFGLTFWQAVLAIALGTGLGAISHGVLSSWGPKTGQCQMVLSRRGFGFLGNFLPAGLNSLTAGIGWFAVNSVSGGLALAALTNLNKYLCLVIVVAAMLAIAYFGHNLIQVFERFAFPVLAVIFVIGAVVILTKFNPGAPIEDTSASAGPVPGGFWIALGATFGYAAGWNPYASDYTRYLQPTAGKAAGVFAGLGLFVSCLLLESVGAAAVTAIGGAQWNYDNPVSSYTGLLPLWLEKLTLLAICLGAVAANALNIYSSALSFTAMGIKLPTRSSRAAMAIVMGTAGFIVAVVGIDNIASYEAFLLVIAYWIGPWLGVVFADRILRRYRPGENVTVNPHYRNWTGFIAMLGAALVSIWLFSNQTQYVGMVPTAFPEIGDITFEVGFLLSFAIYAVLFKPLAGPITFAPTGSVQQSPSAGMRKE